MHNTPRYFSDLRCWRDAMIASGISSIIAGVLAAIIFSAIRTTTPLGLLEFLAFVFAVFCLGSLASAKIIYEVDAARSGMVRSRATSVPQAYVPPQTTYTSFPSIPYSPPAAIAAQPVVPFTVYPTTAAAPPPRVQAQHVKAGRIRHEDTTTYDT